MSIIDTRSPEANYLTRDNIVPSNASPDYIQARLRAVAEWDDVDRVDGVDADGIVASLDERDLVKALKSAGHA